MAELHLSFPAYSLCWINNHQMAVGGGGGTTKSGVKNKLVCQFVTVSEGLFHYPSILQHYKLFSIRIVS